MTDDGQTIGVDAEPDPWGALVLGALAVAAEDRWIREGGPGPFPVDAFRLAADAGEACGWGDS